MEVDVEHVLVNLLANYENVTVRELKIVQDVLESLGVYVDVCKNSLIRASNQNMELFVWDDYGFRRLRLPTQHELERCRVPDRVLTMLLSSTV